jgi:hypothetical protein
MKSWLKGGILFLEYTAVLTLISFLGNLILKTSDLNEYLLHLGDFILIPGNYLYKFIFIVSYLFTGFFIRSGLSENILMIFIILFSSLITIFFMGGILYWIYKKSENKGWLRGGFYGYFIGGLIFYLFSLLFNLFGFSELFGSQCNFEVAFSCDFLFFLSLIIFIILGSIIGWLIGRGRK